jgi:hypothetical protein
MGQIKSLFRKIEQTSEIALRAVIIDVKNVARFDTTAAQVKPLIFST